MTDSRGGFECSCGRVFATKFLAAACLTHGHLVLGYVEDAAEESLRGAYQQGRHHGRAAIAHPAFWIGWGSGVITGALAVWGIEKWVR